MANKNQTAAYPPKVRAKWYFLVEKAGKTVDEICRLYMISRKTYYKWKNVDEGSHRYHTKKEHPETKIKGIIGIFICEEKLRINYGPRIGKYLNGMILVEKFNYYLSTVSPLKVN